MKRQMTTKTKLIPQGVRQTGEKERDMWLTPYWLLEAAKALYGAEPFDPFPENYGYGWDGFSLAWRGYAWVNPPFSRYKEAVEHGVNQAPSQIWICHHNHDTEWFKMLAGHSQVLCLLNRRVAFLDPKTREPKQTAIGKCQSLLYRGSDRNSFARIFGAYGKCLNL